ncbi:hypothetical protein GCM10020255_020100 [Rhodococcus baikonurensis]
MKNAPTAKEIEMKRKTVGGDEVDAFAKTRRSRNWKAGERKALKAKASAGNAAMRELRPRADPNVIRAGETLLGTLRPLPFLAYRVSPPDRTFERTIDMGSNTVTDTCSRITAADRAKALHLFRARDAGTNTAYDDGDLACLMSAVFGLWRDDESSDSTELPHPTGRGHGGFTRRTATRPHSRIHSSKTTT